MTPGNVAPGRFDALRPTVLVVEDDGEMRALLKDFLERAGYRILDLESGANLARTVESEQLDAVILDKEMPGANGLDLLSFLHHRLPAVPVVFVTAFGGPHVADEALRRGAYRYLEKPFRVTVIVDMIDEATGRTAQTERAGRRPR